MYCPKCYNNSLSMASRGVVDIIINGKQMDAGRFLYNINKESKEQISTNFKHKLEEFFKWYSSFKNPDPIKMVQICSNSFVCSNNCAVDLRFKFSIVDILIPRAQIMKHLKDLGDQYGMQLELQVD